MSTFIQYLHEVNTKIHKLVHVDLGARFLFNGNAVLYLCNFKIQNVLLIRPKTNNWRRRFKIGPFIFQLFQVNFKFKWFGRRYN